MVCYAVPAISAMVHYGMRKNVSSMKKSTSHLWLGLMLAGGAIFGIVDHLWNGELFLIGENFVADMVLGLVITAITFLVWAIIVAITKINSKTVIKTA